MNKIYFIVGTDTNAGKTYITAKISNDLIKHGIDIFTIKPVETGKKLFKNSIGSDSFIYSQIMNKNISDVNLYFFNEPLSPHLASKLDNVQIEINKIKEFIDSKKNSIVFCEGAGGLMVPFTENYLYIDLLKDYKNNSKIVIIAKNCLGTINHTLLTIDKIKSEGLNLHSVILNTSLNYKEDNILLLNDNIDIIRKISGEKIFSFDKLRYNEIISCFLKELTQ